MRTIAHAWEYSGLMVFAFPLSSAGRLMGAISALAGGIDSWGPRFPRGARTLRERQCPPVGAARWVSTSGLEDFRLDLRDYSSPAQSMIFLRTDTIAQIPIRLPS